MFVCIYIYLYTRVAYVLYFWERVLGQLASRAQLPCDDYDERIEEIEADEGTEIRRCTDIANMLSIALMVE